MSNQRYFYLRRINSEGNPRTENLVPFKNDEITVGRAADASVKLIDKIISRTHAVFRRDTARDVWIVENLSLNGVFINNESLPKNEKREMQINDIIQFGQPDVFVYQYREKKIHHQASTSRERKRLKASYSSENIQQNLTQEHESLEKRLKECDALKARLKEEQESMHQSIQEQQDVLERKYQLEKQQLEQKYSEGAVAQQAMLTEKESLARQLEEQVMALQNQLKRQEQMLEEKLKNEEMERLRISQEKEDVLKRLEEEKQLLEKRLQEERQDLQDQLKSTESHREELQRQVEEKENMIKAKEEEQVKANEERQQLKDQLAQEKLELQKELEKVKSALDEKNQKFMNLDAELKIKEEEMQDRMLSLESGVQERVIAEVEKSSAIAKKQLEDLAKDKTELEAKLKEAQELGNEELTNLQNALSTVEAQKLSLEQELACSAIISDNARKEVVDTVADVLENELQCSICNELFITAITLGCSHSFCKYCIEQWKKTKRECPNCRKGITAETRALVIDNFIDKIIPTLSEELQEKRKEMIAERAGEIAAMEAAAAAAALAAAANRGNRRGGRRGGRANTRNARYEDFYNQHPSEYPAPSGHHDPNGLFEDWAMNIQEHLGHTGYRDPYRVHVERDMNHPMSDRRSICPMTEWHLNNHRYPQRNFIAWNRYHEHDRSDTGVPVPLPIPNLGPGDALLFDARTRQWQIRRGGSRNGNQRR